MEQVFSASGLPVGVPSPAPELTRAPGPAACRPPAARTRAAQAVSSSEPASRPNNPFRFQNRAAFFLNSVQPYFTPSPEKFQGFPRERPAFCANSHFRARGGWKYGIISARAAKGTRTCAMFRNWQSQFRVGGMRMHFADKHGIISARAAKGTRSHAMFRNWQSQFRVGGMSAIVHQREIGSKEMPSAKAEVAGTDVKNLPATVWQWIPT